MFKVLNGRIQGKIQVLTQEEEKQKKDEEIKKKLFKKWWILIPDIPHFDLWTFIHFGESRLKNLTLHNADLSAVPAQDLLRGLRMLQTVGFLDPTLTTEQVRSIINMITEGSQAKLEKLWIFCPNIDYVARELLEENQNNIIEIDFDD